MFASIISIIPVIIVGVFSYYQSSKHIQEKVNQEKVEVIRQIQSNVEQVLVTVHHTVSNTIDSSLMEAVIRRPLLGEDFSIYRDLRQELSNIRSYYTKVDEVILLNFQEDWLVNNAGLSRLDEHPDKDVYLSYLDLEHNTTWILLDEQQFESPLVVSDCPNTISLVKKLPPKRSAKYGLAFTNISTCSLAEMINVDELSDEVMITDEQFRILVHRDPELIGQSLVDTHYIDSLEGFTDQSGQFNVHSKNYPYAVTYQQSDFNQWYYISFNSIDILTSESKKIGLITFLMITFIVLTCCLYIWIISKKLYYPVNKLVAYLEERWPNEEKDKQKNELEIIESHINELFSSNSSLELELREHTQQLKSLFITRLFTGHYKTNEIQDNLQYFQLEEITMNWREMVICTLTVDNVDNQELESFDHEKMSFAIKNIVEETVQKTKRFPVVWIDQIMVMVLGFDKQSNNEDLVYNLTEKIQTNISQLLKISVSIGISLPFTELKEAKRGYKEGIEALKHRMQLGHGVIVHFSTVNSGKHTVLFDYPKRTEEELVEAIKLADKEKAAQLLSEWMSKAFKNTQSPKEYQVAMMRLLNNLLIIKQESGISFQQINVQHSSLYEELLDFHTKEQIEQWFTDRLITPLIRVFHDRRESQFQNLSEKMIDLIQKNYDQDITLEECAAHLHYNANYLSSVFKQETNYTFTEYLSMYRFTIAKQWLMETNMTVKEIAERLQYKNPQNFIRSFKKQEHMTPGQYREKYKKTP